MGAWFGNQITGWLLTIVFDGLDILWRLLSNSFLVSPDVTVLPQVSSIMDKSLIVVNTCYGLAIIVAGVTVMTHGTVQIRYAVGDLLPRLVVGFIAANFARPLCSGMVEFANALTHGLTGDTVNSKDSFARILTIISSATSNGRLHTLLLVIINLSLAVLTGMLLCAWIMRLGVLIALVGLAPVALACHGLPYTDPVARLWWRGMLGCLGVVMLQAFALHTTLRIFLDPAVNLPTIGLPTDPLSLLNLLIVVCMLWITVKIPGLMRRYATAGGRSVNPVGTVLRMLLIQQASRLLHRPMRGRPAARVAGAPRTPPTTRAGGYRPTIENAVISYWRPRMPRPTRAGATSTATARGNAPSPGPAATAATTGRHAAASRPQAPGGGTAQATATGTRPSAPASRPAIPTGVTPATAVPKTRPAWQTATIPPAPQSVTPTRSVPPPHRVPPGVNPATAVPPRRPTRRA